LNQCIFFMLSKVFYNGVEKSCTIKSLKPNKEYNITVRLYLSALQYKCTRSVAQRKNFNSGIWWTKQLIQDLFLKVSVWSVFIVLLHQLKLHIFWRGQIHKKSAVISSSSFTSCEQKNMFTSPSLLFKSFEVAWALLRLPFKISHFF